MRRWLVAASCALALVTVVVGGLGAQTSSVTSEPGALEGVIEQVYPGSQLLAVRVDKVFLPPTRKGSKVPPVAVVGRTAYVHLASDTRVYDSSGRELTAVTDRAKGGPMPDEVSSALRAGGRCRVEFTGRHQVAAPDTVPEQDRVGSNVLVYKTTSLKILGDV